MELKQSRFIKSINNVSGGPLMEGLGSSRPLLTVFVIPTLISNPGSCYCASWEETGDGSRTSLPNNHVGDPNSIPTLSFRLVQPTVYLRSNSR